MTQPIAESAPTPVPADQSGDRPGPGGRPDTTGHPVVDDVLRSVAAVDGRPLEEQVRVLEGAHARLHAVLAEADVDADATA